MTVEPQGASQVPANVEDLSTGLEEFGVEDMVTPRLTILHREGLFEDSLTKQKYETLNVVILSLAKQRILWPDHMDEGDMPMCRSTDHKTGYPNLELTAKPAEKQFPWENSNFNPTDYPPDADGQIRLPCAGCNLKEWGSDPDGKKPWCAEQFTLAVLYDPFQNNEWVPAILTFQKTSLKPLRNYLTSFARSSTPAFQVYTEVGLDLLKRGQNPYSVAKFKMGSQTNPEEWAEYSIQGRGMQNFLRTPPGRLDEETEPVAGQSTQANEWTGPQQQPQSTAAAAPQSPAPANPGPPAQPTQPAPPQPDPAPAAPEPAKTPQDAPVTAAAPEPAPDPAATAWAAQTGEPTPAKQPADDAPAQQTDPLPF